MPPPLHLLTHPHATYLTRTLHHHLTALHIAVTLVDRVDPVHTIPASEPNAPQPPLYLIPFVQRVPEPLPARYIVYQLEQMPFSVLGKNPSYAKRLANAVVCWDYTRANAPYYRALPACKPPLWLPVPLPTYGAVFDHHPPDDDRPRVDVLFYGTLNSRRARILQALYNVLGAHGLSLSVVRNTFGDELYTCIRRARVVLHLNYYVEAFLATYRLHEALAHRRLVVAESAGYDKDDDNGAQYTGSDAALPSSGVLFVSPVKADLSNLWVGLALPLLRLLHDTDDQRTRLQNGARFVRAYAQGIRHRLGVLLRGFT